MKDVNYLIYERMKLVIGQTFRLATVKQLRGHLLNLHEFTYSKKRGVTHLEDLLLTWKTCRSAENFKEIK